MSELQVILNCLDSNPAMKNQVKTDIEQAVVGAKPAKKLATTRHGGYLVEDIGFNKAIDEYEANLQAWLGKIK